MPDVCVRVPQRLEENIMFLGRDFTHGRHNDWRAGAGVYAVILVAFLCTAFVAAISDSQNPSGQQIAQHLVIE
jgi:hypothetical protein